MALPHLRQVFVGIFCRLLGVFCPFAHKKKPVKKRKRHMLHLGNCGFGNLRCSSVLKRLTAELLSRDDVSTTKQKRGKYARETILLIPRIMSQIQERILNNGRPWLVKIFKERGGSNGPIRLFPSHTTCTYLYTFIICNRMADFRAAITYYKLARWTLEDWVPNRSPLFWDSAECMSDWLSQGQ